MVLDTLKHLSKKYNFDTDVWRKYLEVTFELKELKEQGKPGITAVEPKDILSRCL
jgi:hypothetical protein